MLSETYEHLSEIQTGNFDICLQSLDDQLLNEQQHLATTMESIAMKETEIDQVRQVILRQRKQVKRLQTQLKTAKDLQKRRDSLITQQTARKQTIINTYDPSDAIHQNDYLRSKQHLITSNADLHQQEYVFSQECRIFDQQHDRLQREDAIAQRTISNLTAQITKQNEEIATLKGRLQNEQVTATNSQDLIVVEVHLEFAIDERNIRVKIRDSQRHIRNPYMRDSIQGNLWNNSLRRGDPGYEDEANIAASQRDQRAVPQDIWFEQWSLAYSLKIKGVLWDDDNIDYIDQSISTISKSLIPSLISLHKMSLEGRQKNQSSEFSIGKESSVEQLQGQLLMLATENERLMYKLQEKQAAILGLEMKQKRMQDEMRKSATTVMWQQEAEELKQMQNEQQNRILKDLQEYIKNVYIKQKKVFETKIEPAQGKILALENRILYLEKQIESMRQGLPHQRELTVSQAGLRQEINHLKSQAGQHQDKIRQQEAIIASNNNLENQLQKCQNDLRILQTEKQNNDQAAYYSNQEIERIHSQAQLEKNQIQLQFRNQEQAFNNKIALQGQQIKEHLATIRELENSYQGERNKREKAEQKFQNLQAESLLERENSLDLSRIQAKARESERWVRRLDEENHILKAQLESLIQAKEKQDLVSQRMTDFKHQNALQQEEIFKQDEMIRDYNDLIKKQGDYIQILLLQTENARNKLWSQEKQQKIDLIEQEKCLVEQFRKRRQMDVLNNHSLQGASASECNQYEAHPSHSPSRQQIRQGPQCQGSRASVGLREQGNQDDNQTYVSKTIQESKDYTNYPATSSTDDLTAISRSNDSIKCWQYGFNKMMHQPINAASIHSKLESRMTPAYSNSRILSKQFSGTLASFTPSKERPYGHCATRTVEDYADY